MKKASISQWYNRRAIRPLVGLIVFTLIFCGFMLWVWLGQSQNSEHSRISDYREAFSTAINHKNRIMVENLLSISKSSLGASAAAICQGNRAVIVEASDNSFCVNKAEWGYKKIVVSIPGIEDQKIIYEISLFHRYQLAFFIALGMLIFIGTLLVLVMSLRKHIFSDLVRPLEEGLKNQSSIPIRELEKIRQDQINIANAKAHKELYETLSESVGIISHSLSSPMSFLSVSGLTWKNHLPEVEFERFKNSVENISKILSVLTRFRQKDLGSLEPARQLEALKSDIESEVHGKVDLKDSITGLAADKEREYRSLGLKVEFKNLTTNLPQIDVPKSQLETLLSDIVNNSVEAYENEAPLVEITLEKVGDAQRITVIDKAKGMAPEVLKRVFEKRFTHGKPHGTGLGLYNAKMQVEKMGGKIWIESELGAGTKVFIELNDGEIFRNNLATV